MKFTYYLKKTLLYASMALLLFVAAGAAFTYFYKDKIVGLFVAEANKHLVGKVDVGKIDLTLWKKFPQIALTLENVQAQESIPGSTLPLARLKKLYFTFSLFKIVRGKYEVNRVYLEQGEVTIRINENGLENYLIFKEDGESEGGSVNFNLENISLVNVVLNYRSAPDKQDFSVLVRNAASSLQMEGDELHTAVKGDVYIHKLAIDGDTYGKDKEINLNTKLSYHLKNKLLTLAPSEARIQKALFEFGGTVQVAQETQVDLAVEGKNADIQTLLSLLPSSLYDKVKAYRSKGEAYFKGNIKGKVSQQHAPAINVSFGCNNASIYHPDLKKNIEKAYLAGTFSNGAAQSAKTSTLKLSNVRGLLDGKLFEADFYMQNFADPYVKMVLNAKADAASVTAFYPIDLIKNASGQLVVDFNFEGRVEDLKHPSRLNKIKTSGEIQINELGFMLTEKPLAFSRMSGNFIFNNNDVAITDFKGNIGRSDFMLNGYFRNFISYVLFPNQGMNVKASFRSALLDLDELLSANAGTQKGGAEEEYRFLLPQQLAFELDCHVRHVKFRRFTGKNIGGQLALKNKVAHFRGVSMQAMGGQVKFAGTLDARQQEAIEIQTKASMNRLYIDSTFYAFENFEQTFLQDKNLKGQFTADMDAFMVMNSKLEPDARRLLANINGTIYNGELNNFEPMMALSKFIDRRELANMRFSELKNSLQIENKKITIPEMEIRSNVATIYVMGTHTFDQKMDYNLRIPLSNLRRAQYDKVDVYEAAEQDASGGMNLLLTLKGDADDFKIAYDKQKAKEKIKEGLVREKNEILSIFKSKETRRQEEIAREEKEIAKPKKPEEPEFFDF
jgi:hypothetical protein